jgi:hypothetical protein
MITDYASLMEKNKIKTLDLYTFFPYTTQKCGEVTDVIILEKWLLQKNGRFDSNADLFPLKTPNDFMGCPVRVSVVGFKPFSDIVDNHTEIDGSIVYDLRGAVVDIFLISMTKLNLSIVFLPPDVHLSINSFMKALIQQREGLSDILIGFVPILPMITQPGFFYTSYFMGTTFTLFIPCPSRIYKMGKLFSIFTLPVWLTLALAFILTSATLWYLENKSSLTKSRKLPNVTVTSLPVYNAWAILMGVSVPKMPDAWTHRFLFLVYVCFCFAIVTIVQTSFVSYLVEPGFGKAIETFQEAIDSDLRLTYSQFGRQFLDTLDDEAYLIKFPDIPQAYCFNLVECTKQLIIQRDVALMNAEIYVRYIASVLGFVDYSKVICYVDDSTTYVHSAGLLQKGSPFLNGINKMMRRYLECGLMDRDLKNVNFFGHLTNMGSDKLVDDTQGAFFVFTLHHLQAAFVVLLLGHTFSCFVFICEVIHKRASCVS